VTLFALVEGKIGEVLNEKRMGKGHNEGELEINELDCPHDFNDHSDSDEEAEKGKRLRTYDLVWALLRNFLYCALWNMHFFLKALLYEMLAQIHQLIIPHYLMQDLFSSTNCCLLKP
jgi:hypothetical protein